MLEVYETLSLIPCTWWLDSEDVRIGNQKERSENLKIEYDKDYIIYLMIRRHYDKGKD